MQKIKRPQRIAYYAALLILFVLCGKNLGTIPLWSCPPYSITSMVRGGVELFRVGNGVNIVSGVAYPYGLEYNEGFFLNWVTGFFRLFGLSAVAAMILCYFFIYCIGFWSAVKLFEQISNRKKLVVLAGTALFFFDPFLTSEGGLSQVFLGNLLLPAVALADYKCFRIIKERDKLSAKKGFLLIGFSLLMKLIATLTGWYTAVISACTTCLFLLLYTIGQMCFKKDRTAWVPYCVYCILPWMMAMAATLMLTPKSVAGMTSPLEFYNGNSVDVITMLLPSNRQLISRIVPSVSVILNGRVLTANGESHNTYIGYILLGSLIYLCTAKKTRSGEAVCLALTFCVGLIISIGPGLKWMGVTAATGYESYLYPMDKVIAFPWAKVFTHIFPLTSMRAVYRWMLMPKFALVIAFSVFLTRMEETKIRWIYVFAILAIFEFFPALSAFSYPRKAINMLQQFENDAINELIEAKDQLNTENATVVFLGYDFDPNTFLAGSLNNTLETISYTGQGDKALSVAYKYTPQSIKSIQNAVDVEQLSTLISKIEQFRICDLVVFPYFEMREQSYYWPPSDSIKNRCANIARQVRDNLPEYPYLELDNYMIFDLRSQAEPGEIKVDDYCLYDTIPFETTLPVDETIEEVYFYAMATYDGSAQDSTAFEVAIADENGKLIEQIPYSFSKDSNVCAIEHLVEVPKGTERVSVMLNAPSNGRVELRDLTISTVDRDRFFVSKTENDLKSVGFDMIESYSNVEISDETVNLKGNGEIFLKKDSGEAISALTLDMDIIVEDDSCFGSATIVSKWTHWQNNMSFAFGLKEEKSFIIITEDGITPNAIWFDNNLLNGNVWHHVLYTFDHGRGELWIDDQCIQQIDYPFYSIYNSNETAFVIGNSFVGSITGFLLSYN